MFHRLVFYFLVKQKWICLNFDKVQIYPRKTLDFIVKNDKKTSFLSYKRVHWYKNGIAICQMNI